MAEDTELLKAAIRALEEELREARAKIAEVEGRQRRTSDRAHKVTESVTDLEERVSDEGRAVIRHVRRLELALAELAARMATHELERQKKEEAAALSTEPPLWAKRWLPVTLAVLAALAGAVSEILRAMH